MKSDGAKTEATPSGQTAINTNYEIFILALSVLSIFNLVVEILPFAQDVKDLVTIVDSDASYWSKKNTMPRFRRGWRQSMGSRKH
jgi:hypothetical protein